MKRMKWKESLFLLPALFVVLAVVISVVQNKPVFSGILYPEAKTEKKETVQQEASEQRKDKTERVSAKQTENFGENILQDGVYEGVGSGYGGNITVQVTIVDGKIDKITVTNHSGETPAYFSRALEVVDRMLAAQGPNVDLVSGATYSSGGIRDAVIQALQKASGKKVAAVTTVRRKNSSSPGKKKAKKQTTGEPAEGVYVGTAVCEQFGYTLSLKVRFQGGKATAISGLKISNNTDSANAIYWKKAWKPMVKRILKAQSSQVDVVSGATYSSNAIVSAYLNAREKAINANNKNKKTKKKSSKKKSATTVKTPLVDTVHTPPTGQVIDGVYTVSAGCEPDEKKAFASYMLTADVTFSNGKLVSISRFSSNAESNRSYYLKAANGNQKSPGVVTQLLEKQSASGITAVSGATCSSKTIYLLYLQALTKAAGTTKTDFSKEDEIAVPSPSPSEDTGEEDSGNGEEENLEGAEGYTVTVTVYPDEWQDFDAYSLTADVYFREGKLVAVNHMMIESDAVNQEYSKLAANGVIKRLLEAQSSEVDVVSGATCSSKALIALYERALEMMKEEVE